jgi:hypothetical protein
MMNMNAAEMMRGSVRCDPLLPDPDEGWSAEDGGALELYPVVAPGTPAVDPTECLLPAWNSMAFFTVQPGRSFHSVQEVFAKDKPRLSISGWYHAAEPPAGSEHATLTQLHTRRSGGDGGVDDDVRDFTPFPSAVAAVVAAAAAADDDKKGKGLAAAADEENDDDDDDDEDDDEPLGPDEADLEYLADWVNSEYLNPANVAQIREKMEEDSSVQMREFLHPRVAAAIRGSTRVEDETSEVGKGRVPARAAGVGGGWRAVGPTHKQHYMVYEDGSEGAAAAKKAAAAATKKTAKAAKAAKAKDPKGKGKNVENVADDDEHAPAGSLLHALKTELFQSEAFARLLTALTVGLYKLNSV